MKARAFLLKRFEGHNLIFVDEGHKGSGSEARAWKKVRNRLAGQWLHLRIQRHIRASLGGSKRR